MKFSNYIIAQLPGKWYPYWHFFHTFFGIRENEIYAENLLPSAAIVRGCVRTRDNALAAMGTFIYQPPSIVVTVILPGQGAAGVAALAPLPVGAVAVAIAAPP